MDKVLSTGGALGSDSYFAEICKELGFAVQVHSFEGHKTYGVGDIIIHTQDELQQADEHLMAVSTFLKRPFPNKNNYINNLLRRNYLIVKDVDVIFAVGKLQSPYIVEGGTGWACELGRRLDKMIIIFNLTDNHWYTSSKNTNYWPLACKTPNISSKFAGIGTRHINKQGRQAIRSLMATTE